jgi:hypothetical protein
VFFLELVERLLQVLERLLFFGFSGFAFAFLEVILSTLLVLRGLL